MDKPEQASPKLMAQVARLAAVQTVYNMALTGQGAQNSVHTYMEYYAGMELDGDRLAMPDKALFSRVVQGVDTRRDDLEGILTAHYNGDAVTLEPLLKSIFLCGVFELLEEQSDAPVIINDYLNVAHEFYEKSEVSLINGVLDSAAKALKSA